MIKPKTSKQKMLPLALFSMAVLIGCGSDDDDDGGAVITPPVTDGGEVTPPDGGEVTPPATGGGVIGDADGNGIADAFEAAVTGGADINGNAIDDTFDSELTGGADSNENQIDDSFEAAVTGGADTDADGIDDSVDGDVVTGAPVEPIVQTGQLNDISIGFNENNVGIGFFNFDGSTLSGTVEIADGVQATTASIFSGIPAGGTGEQVVQLNGSSPTFSTPLPIGPDETQIIADNIQSGNLFLQVDLANGGSQTGPILLNGVTPTFTNLDSASVVPAGTANSTGQGSMNINTVTGNYSAVVTFVNLNAGDLDAAGNPQTISGVSISNGAAGETGAAIVNLTDTGGGTTWTAQGIFNPTDLATVLGGNANFTALGTDGTPFLRGQILEQ